MHKGLQKTFKMQVFMPFLVLIRVLERPQGINHTLFSVILISLPLLSDAKK